MGKTAASGIRPIINKDIDHISYKITDNMSMMTAKPMKHESDASNGADPTPSGADLNDLSLMSEIAKDFENN